MKIVICDNDMDQATEGKSLILACAAKYNIDATVDIAESGKKLLFYKDTKYAGTDLIYIIYHLPDMNGMETSREMRRRGYVGDIVFYTFDPSHAREGYEVDALAYLLKDREQKTMHEKVFLKAAQRCQKRHTEMMTVSCRGEYRNIPIDNILYFEVQHHLVTICYLNNGKRVEKFGFYSSLSKIEKSLCDKGFIRPHISYLVAERRIYRKTSNQIEMENGDVIPIAKRS